MLEVASASTADEDTGPKEARLRSTGNFRILGVSTRPATTTRPSWLAGDRLVDGHYGTIAIEELDDGVLQGYSAALNLHLRWEQGELRWHDSATGRHILTYDDQRARADNAQSLAQSERAARAKAEQPADTRGEGRQDSRW